MTLTLQGLGGINYLIIFGIVVAAEIGLCKFIGTCADDFKAQFNQLAEANYRDSATTRSIIKEAITIHQEMRLYAKNHRDFISILYIFA